MINVRRLIRCTKHIVSKTNGYNKHAICEGGGVGGGGGCKTGGILPFL